MNFPIHVSSIFLVTFYGTIANSCLGKFLRNSLWLLLQYFCAWIFTIPFCNFAISSL